MNQPSIRNRKGMTSVDVIAGIGICLFLFTMLVGCLSRGNNANTGVKCANNLRQIGLAAMMYANGEIHTGAFPRACFSTTSTKLITGTTGYGKPISFDRDAVGDNNVTASFFLILKTQDITPDAFICPATYATCTAGFGTNATIKVQDSSNWESIPKNMTYSYNCPFPTEDALKNGWKFNNTLGSDFPLAADLNPGGDALLKLTPTSSAKEMNAGNSRNHQGEGQEVLYCDAHVEFQTTPFCGHALDDKPGSPRDNIYTSGGPSDSKGGDAIVAMPVSPSDAVLLPTGDATAK